MTDTARPAVERMHPPEVLWKHLVNPVMRAVLHSPAHRLVDRHLLLLEFHGRRTGTHYAIPVGHRHIDGRMTVLTNAGWRVNFRGSHSLTVRLGGEVRSGTGHLEEDPEIVASTYEQLIDEYGWRQAGRRMGIRLNVDRAPTHDELVDAVQANGLSLLRIDLD